MEKGAELKKEEIDFIKSEILTEQFTKRNETLIATTKQSLKTSSFVKNLNNFTR